MRDQRGDYGLKKIIIGIVRPLVMVGLCGKEGLDGAEGGGRGTWGST